MILTEKLVLDRLVEEVRESTVKSERLREAGEALNRAIEDHRVLTDRNSLLHRQVEGLGKDIHDRTNAHALVETRLSNFRANHKAYVRKTENLISAARELIHLLELPSQNKLRREIPKRRGALYGAIIDVEALETPF